MYKIKIFLENLRVTPLALVLLIYSQVVFSQNALNVTFAERGDFRAYCEEYISSASLDDPKDVSKALWIISAFNQTSKEAKEYLDKLAEHYDSLGTQQQFDFVSLLRGRELDKKPILLQKALASEDNKLSLLAYSLLDNMELANWDDRNYREEWNNIKTQIQEKSYDYELSEQEFNELKVYISTTFPHKFHLFVLVRADRNIPAKVWVIDAEGKKMNKKPLYYLARSANNTLPYFTNGNTPCGVFKIYGKSVSDNMYIGPVPTLVTELPFESKVTSWGGAEQQWTESIYESFLPLTLRSIPMLWQAYDAGRVGRSEIIVHGSTIDPYFYSEECFFPLTPSLGCLSAFEIWSSNDGNVIESHQRTLVDMLPDDNADLGFMYVVQVDKGVYKQF